MGSIKQRLDEVLKRFKLLQEINRDQDELIKVLQERNEELEALN